MSYPKRPAVVLFLTLSLLPLQIRAQSQAATATLEGTIKDQTGAVVPGVTVTATSRAMALSRIVLSSNTGLYRIPLLPPGSYEVRAELPGFATQVREGVLLSVGQFAPLDFSMTVSATQTEVVVQADAQMVEVSKTQLSETINQTQINSLPINGRNYLDFTLLTPGVTNRNPM
ncbi:MAG: carboxypeptidase regulatory-like domain-containing protein, partial [Acidobacteria bacterium]|nr:carboxypeptidase regulatory-like domain-containing protein [Acidobacteriota bacterium]